MRRFVPALVGFDLDVERDQKLAHAGHLGQLAGRIESVVEGLDGRVVVCNVQRGREGQAAHLEASTIVNEQPSAEALADIALTAAHEAQRFGLPAKVAFLSHSLYGSSQRESAKRMRAARNLFVQQAPDIMCDGELQGNAALSEVIHASALAAGGTLCGAANLLVCPNLDAANILFVVLKVTASQGVTIGPILLGAAAPVHILTPSATMRRVVNMTALAVADAADHGRR